MNMGIPKLMEDRLNIQMLDHLEIVFGDVSLDDVLGRTRKGRSLVCLLILHQGRPVPYQTLFRALWKREDVQDLDNVLKVLVSRTRALFAEVDESLRDCIQGQKGTYRWNMDRTGDVDVFTIQALSQELLALESVNEGFLSKLETFLCMYSGRLLPEERHIPWIEELGNELEDQYRITVTHAIALLEETQNWKAIVKVCRMGLNKLADEHGWHEAMLRALLMLNKQGEAMTQYKHLMDVQRAQDTEAQAATALQLFTDMEKSGDALENDLEEIADELIECQESIVGVQVCEYVIFRYVYEQQVRCAERYGMNNVLAMLKVSNVLDAQLQPLVLEDAMQKLSKVLQQQLRKGDTVSRFTPSQYVVLLQNPAAGSAQRILERVKLAFYQEINNMSILLNYRYKPLNNGKKEPKIKAL